MRHPLGRPGSLASSPPSFLSGDTCPKPLIPAPAHGPAERAHQPPAPLTPPATPRQAPVLDQPASNAQPAAQCSAAPAALSLAELWGCIGRFLSCPLDLAAAYATNVAARAALASLLGSLRPVAAAELLHVTATAAAVQHGATQVSGPTIGVRCTQRTATNHLEALSVPAEIGPVTPIHPISTSSQLQEHRPVEQCLHAILGYTGSTGWLSYVLGSALLPGFCWVLHACPGHAPAVGLAPRGSALPWLASIYDPQSQRLVSTGVVLVSRPARDTTCGLSGELAWSAAMQQQPSVAADWRRTPLVANHVSRTGCSFGTARGQVGAALLLRSLSRLPAAELAQLSRLHCR